jgi:hypothetical protein
MHIQSCRRHRSASEIGRQVECSYIVAGTASALGAGSDIPSSANLGTRYRPSIKHINMIVLLCGTGPHCRIRNDPQPGKLARRDVYVVHVDALHEVETVEALH